MKEDWYKMETDSDMKKLIPLVDFLDGENEKYTANQPRRFLAQKKGKNRRPATYTKNSQIAIASTALMIIKGRKSAGTSQRRI